MVARVGTHGAGHDAAVPAMKILNSQSVDAIPAILKGMNDASPLAVNWLRSSIVSIVGRGGEIPKSEIQKYFDDRDNSHLGRLLAYDLLSGQEGWTKKTIPLLLDDPSMPLRRKAIDLWIERAESADAQGSLGYLTMALNKARDIRQVGKIAKLLKEKGIEINLQKQLGFLPKWQLVGTFDNKDEGGFDKPFGPELSLQKVDMDAKYKDVNGKEVAWSSYETTEATGLVDLNSVIGKIKGVTAYAFTTFDASESRDAEIRIGSSNAHKIWLNGELVVSNEVYHNGLSPDKFSGKIQLKEGENTILVKISQNEMTQPWAQQWDFQIRICDATGKAILPVAPIVAEN